MLDLHTARDRAIRRAIETGQMPNIDLIHKMQKDGGYQPCFGRAEGACHQARCRWHCECMSLAAYRPRARSPIWASSLRGVESSPAPIPVSRTYRSGEVAPAKPEHASGAARPIHAADKLVAQQVGRPSGAAALVVAADPT